MLKQRFIDYYRSLRASLTFGVVVLSGCLLLLALFGWLSDEVLEREAFGFDTTTLLWLHRHSNAAIDNLMLGIANLGNPNFVIPLVAIVFSILIWHKRVWTAQILFLTCLGAAILNQGLKLVFVKPRPQLWTPLIVERTFSYPSGHALGSAVLYGFLAIVLAQGYPRYRWVIYLSAILLVGAIGLSRLILGVHYPTDIIAGYAVGIPWLAACVKILQIGANRELKDR
jgi:membrane-associated phospholipid phosphatase